MATLGAVGNPMDVSVSHIVIAKRPMCGRAGQVKNEVERLEGRAVGRGFGAHVPAQPNLIVLAEVFQGDARVGLTVAVVNVAEENVVLYR